MSENSRTERSSSDPKLWVNVLETGLVQLRIDFGPVDLAILLTKDEAFSLSGDLNGAALGVWRAEGK